MFFNSLILLPPLRNPFPTPGAYRYAPQGSADDSVASGPPPSGGHPGGRPLLTVPSGSGSGSGSGGFVSLNGVSMVLGGEETPRWDKAGGGEGGPDSSPRLDYLRARSAATRYVRAHDTAGQEELGTRNFLCRVS